MCIKLKDGTEVEDNEVLQCLPNSEPLLFCFNSTSEEESTNPDPCYSPVYSPLGSPSTQNSMSPAPSSCSDEDDVESNFSDTPSTSSSRIGDTPSTSSSGIGATPSTSSSRIGATPSTSSSRIGATPSTSSSRIGDTPSTSSSRIGDKPSRSGKTGHFCLPNYCRLLCFLGRAFRSWDGGGGSFWVPKFDHFAGQLFSEPCSLPMKDHHLKVPDPKSLENGFSLNWQIWSLFLYQNIIHGEKIANMYLICM